MSFTGAYSSRAANEAVVQQTDLFSFEEPHKSGPGQALDGSSNDVDLPDYHGRILYVFGTNDIKVLLNSDILLRPVDVFFDIGANYSSIGFQASRAVDPTGEVHLFEPQGYLVDRVRAAIERGGLTNVKPFLRPYERGRDAHDPHARPPFGPRVVRGPQLGQGLRARGGLPSS